MFQSRFPPKLVTPILLSLFFGISLYLRICLPYDQVFSGEWIKFTGNDPYYHMRLVDSLLHNFPHFLAFDPYTLFLHGTPVYWPPFFDWLLTATIWIFSLGTPTERTVDIIGVYFPAILGALVVVPVYFIGKELFSRWAGFISAGLIAVLPGEFLGRTILGFTDHHVAETLFTSIVILFLILAIKTTKQQEITLSHLKRLEWRAVARPLMYTLLTGIFLALYLLSWIGGLFFIFVISVYFIAQFIIDHLMNKSTDYLGIVGTLSLLIATAFSLPLMPQTLYRVILPTSLVIATLIPAVLYSLSLMMVRRKIRRAYYPLALLGLGIAGLLIFYVIDPGLLGSMIRRFGIFTPSGTSLTISEVQPLLFPQGNFSLATAWGNFTTGFFLSFIAIAVLIYTIVKNGNAEKSLLVIWSLLILAATLGQRRFAYYLAVNVALLTGYLSWQALQFIWLKTSVNKLENKTIKKRKSKHKTQKEGLRLTTRHLTIAISILIVFFLVFYPNLKPSISTAKKASFTPSDGWYSALLWLNKNTPEPFGNPDAYYELYESPPPGEDYDYPESAYGVMAWWDYGHMITRIGHRIPISNPFQGGVEPAAKFFTSQQMIAANEIMDSLGAKYIIIDHETADENIMTAMAIWAGVNPKDLFDIYYQLHDGKLWPVKLFHPEYYRSLSIRLYTFNADEVIPENTDVISYQERVNADGTYYKEIITWESFPTYEAASSYLLRQKTGDYRIVNRQAYLSPVPLEALHNYKLVYSSDEEVKQPGIGMVPAIKIFEYAK